MKYNYLITALLGLTLFSNSLLSMNSDDDLYDLDDIIQQDIHSGALDEDFQKRQLISTITTKMDTYKPLLLQSIIRGNEARNAFNKKKPIIINLQSIIRGNTARNKSNELRQVTVNLQSLLRGNQERNKQYQQLEQKKCDDEFKKNGEKNYLSSKPTSSNLAQNLIKNNFETTKSKMQPLLDKINLQTHYYLKNTADFSKQCKNSIVRLAQSVSKDEINPNDQKIADETAKFMNDVRAGAQIVYAMNFASDEDFSWSTILDPNIDPVNAYITALQQACSFYYYLNAQQRPDTVGFIEGTFFIETTNDRWSKFFDKLAIQVQISKRPSAYYKRISSHDFGELSYGMDFRTSEESGYQEWLYRFKTFLISQTTKGIWIKPEHYGCYYWSDVPNHLAGWIESQAGKLANYDYYDKPEWNKERTPKKIQDEFKELFTEYKGPLTLRAMYQHALHNKQITFASKLKQTYSAINYRCGNECYIDEACLLESFFVGNNSSKEIVVFYAVLRHFKDVISLLKQNKLKENKKNEQVHDAAQLLISNFAVIKKQLSKQVADYFTSMITVIKYILSQKNSRELLAQEPIFEYEFQKEFLLNEEQKQVRLKKLKNEAKEITERDKGKIALAKDLWDILTKYCTESTTMLDKLLKSETIANNFEKAPDFRSAESTQLQIYLSTQEINNVNEVFGLENMYDNELFTATHNLNNDTTGLRKITELRMFKYMSNNPFVKSYELDNMQCIKELTTRICKIAWAAKTNKDAREKATVMFNALFKQWHRTLDKVYNMLEIHGYGYISKTGKGQEITETVLSDWASKIDMLKELYNNLQEEFATLINESGMKESNKERFTTKYNELFKKVFDDLDFNTSNLFDFIKVRIQVAKTADELQNMINSCIATNVNFFDWDNPMIYSAQRLKLFHEIVLKEIAKEENQENLMISQFGKNVIDNFENNN